MPNIGFSLALLLVCSQVVLSAPDQTTSLMIDGRLLEIDSGDLKQVESFVEFKLSRAKSHLARRKQMVESGRMTSSSLPEAKIEIKYLEMLSEGFKENRDRIAEHVLEEVFDRHRVPVGHTSDSLVDYLSMCLEEAKELEKGSKLQIEAGNLDLKKVTEAEERVKEIELLKRLVE